MEISFKTSAGSYLWAVRQVWPASACDPKYSKEVYLKVVKITEEHVVFKTSRVFACIPPNNLPRYVPNVLQDVI